jgi:DNA polymerase (family 10)
VDNGDIARVLEEMGDIVDLLGDSPFKARAFHQAAHVVDLLPAPVAELWRSGRLTEVPSIGARIADKIGELIETGSCAEHRELAARVPAGLIELLRLEGLGPRTVAAAWRTLGVGSVDDLEAAIRDGRILGLPRFGKSRAQALLGAIERHRARRGRTQIHRALGLADSIIARLRTATGVLRVEAAGSLRRRCETVGDLDILVGTRDPDPVMRAFTALDEVAAVLGQGPTRSAVRLHSGLQVDLRAVDPDCFGAALHYFTGSKAHNVALRGLAARRGLKINEYGVFDESGARLGGATEEQVFAAVGLPWIPPELREGAGELEAAAAGTLPVLIEESDLRGDLHLHSDWSSDARSSIDEVLEKATLLGREYLALTDHSRSRPGGLDEARLDAEAAAIAAASARLRARVGPGALLPRLLRGIEVDILGDGSLDLDPAALARLDWVVASIHARFNDPSEQITARLVAAIRSGVVDLIGHPSGRLIGKRDPYPFDLPAVLAAAREEGVALEVNANPDRLDLTDKACRAARDAGVKVAINTDAHLADHLANVRYGVWVARRGWLEKGDVVNARPVEALRADRRNRRPA